MSNCKRRAVRRAVRACVAPLLELTELAKPVERPWLCCNALKEDAPRVLTQQQASSCVQPKASYIERITTHQCTPDQR